MRENLLWPRRSRFSLDRNKNDLMIDTDGEISDDYTQIKLLLFPGQKWGN